MAKEQKFPRCNRMDCKANEGGACKALTDNNFGERACPFYKKGEPKRDNGDIFINERTIDKHTKLRRVINAAGVEYSLLIIDGVELLSSPTTNEKGMIEYYKENKEILCG